MSPARPRVLVTLPDVAWPLDGGKRLRCAGVLRGLAEVADVDVLVLFSRAEGDGAPFADDVSVRRWLRLAPPPLPLPRAAVRLVSARVPWMLAAQRWDEVRSRLAQWADPDGYDLVWYGGLDHAVSLRGAVDAPASVVDFDDIETQKWRAYLQQPVTSLAHRAERLQRRIELPLWAGVQRRAVADHDTVVVCSEEDAASLRATGAPSVGVVPNTYPDPGPPVRVDGAPVGAVPGAEPVFLLIGNFAVAANLDAARQLVEHVLPDLQRRVPTARVRIVGRSAGLVPVPAGARGLQVEERTDVRGELLDATAALVPMRFGGGTRLKVLEAFAVGLPVVTSRLGGAGLGAVHGEHLLFGDTPGALAEGAARLVQEPELPARLAAAARALYLRDFAPSAATAAVAEVVEPLLQGRPPR